MKKPDFGVKQENERSMIDQHLVFCYESFKVDSDRQFQRYLLDYGHSTEKIPVLVRSPKSSSVAPG